VRVRNTGITYGSDERKPQILQEFAELLPPLTEEQWQALEADILRNGCYSPIIVCENLATGKLKERSQSLVRTDTAEHKMQEDATNDVCGIDAELNIVDGHNRQRICEEHDLPYTMAVFEFADKLEAMQWALDTQKGRRNLDKWELGKIALKLKPEIEARAKANQGNRTDLLVNSPKSLEAVNTRKEMAQAVGLGEQTMGRIAQIDEKAPEAVKKALDKGELSVNKGYELTKKLEAVPEAEREAAAAEALEYEKAKKEMVRQNAEIDRKSKIANLYCKVFEKAILLEVT